MAEGKRESDVIKVTITGDVSGQVAVGKDIVQQQTADVRPQVTEADIAAIRQMLDDLRAQVAAQAPDEKKDAALERVDELEEAITAEEPDLTTMEYVKKWFAKHLPQLAGAVTSVVVNPIVGKVVEAAGEVAANEFRRRFGSAPPR